MSFDIDALYRDGLINDYFYNQLKRNTQYYSDEPDMVEAYIEDAIAMSNVGVNSPQEQKEFWHVVSNVPDVADEMLLRGYPVRPAQEAMRVFKDRRDKNYISDDGDISQLARQVYENRKNYPIDTILNLYHAVAHAAQELGIPLRADIMARLSPKVAYPQGYTGSAMQTNYSVERWMQATRDIYARANKGQDLNVALAEITADWDKMEKTDYKHWLRFYQEGAQNKYKLAQYYVSDSGVYIPNKLNPTDLRATLPTPVKPMQMAVPGPAAQHADHNTVQDRIEMQRARIISRLNAAEKMLSSLEGQHFAGEEQEYMLKLLQDLKRKVQTANKIRISSTLFEDLIYRTANYLRLRGKRSPASFFYKIAQDPSGDPASALLGNMEEPPAPGGAAPETNGPAIPELGDVPGTDPSMSGGGGGAVDEAKQSTIDTLREFFKLIEQGVADGPDDEDLEVKKAEDEFAAIVVEAQVAPEAVPMQPEGDIEVEEPPDEPSSAKVEDKINNVIDNALKNVTINDLIAHFEELSSFFKKREIARRLALGDMMMDAAGLSSFFPSLGEATRSALESNQYVSTRVEEILNKLRGAIGNVDDIMEPDEQNSTPETNLLVNNLQQQQTEDEERKAQRRQREEARNTQPVAAPGTPEPPVEAPAPELAAPATVAPSAVPAIPR